MVQVLDPAEFLKGGGPQVPTVESTAPIDPRNKAASDFLRGAVPKEAAPIEPQDRGLSDVMGDFLERAFPSLIGDQTRRDPFPVTRATSIAAFATIGGVAGLPLGPVGAGTGAVLGAIGGTFFPEATLSVSRAIGLDIAPGVKGLSTKEIARRAVEESLIEVMFAGIGILREPIGRVKDKIFRSLANVTEESRVFARLAKNKFRVELDIVTLAGEKRLGRFVQATPDVVGVFPFIRTFLVRGAQRRGTQVVDAAELILDRIGPSVDVAIRSELINRMARLTFSRFGRESTQLYKNFKKIALRTKASYFPNLTRATAQRLTREWEGARAKLLAPRGPGGRFAPRELDKVKDPIKGILDDFSRLEGAHSIRQMDDGLAGRISREMGRKDLNKTQIGRLMELKDAVQRDLRVNSKIGKEAADALEIADNFFSKGMRIFETGTAKKLGRIDRNIFKIKFEMAGTTSKDRLFDVLVKNATPSELKELHSLLGSKTFKTQVAGWVGDKLDDVSKIRFDSQGRPISVEIDADQFARQLGISTKRGLKGSSFRKMMKLIGQDPQEIEDFIQVARVAMRALPAEMKQFVARRATLGGARAASRTLLPAASAARSGKDKTSWVKAVIMSLGVRHWGKMITDPRKLRLTKFIFKDQGSVVFKTGLQLRLARLIIESPDFSDEEKVVYRDIMVFLSRGEANLRDLFGVGGGA